MSKTAQPQGAFSFLDEVEKVDPLPKPKKNTLTPPAQIEISEELPDIPEATAEETETIIEKTTP